VRSLPPGSPHKRGNGPPPLAGAFASGASFFLPISPGRRAKPVPQGRPRRGPGDPPGLGLIGFDGACGPVGQASRFGDKGAQQPQARMTGAGSMALPVAFLASWRGLWMRPGGFCGVNCRNGLTTLLRPLCRSCRSVQGEGQSPSRRVALDGGRVIRPASV
jgi:hypothetical protein